MTLTISTPERVEKAARAIADTLHKCGKLKAGYDDVWSAGPCLVAAQAAIEATGIESLLADKARLEEAMEKIVRWHTSYHEDGAEEMREIARAALNTTKESE